MAKQRHLQKKLQLWTGEYVSVDSRLVSFIRLMNRPGLQTFNSCQEVEHMSQGYVHFGGILAPVFAQAVLRHMLRSDLQLLTGLTFEKAYKNPTWPNSYVIRWSAYNHKNFMVLVEKALADLD